MPHTLAEMLPEDTRALLLAGLRVVRAEVQALTSLLLHDERTGEDTRVPMAVGIWQELTGQPGVKMYPVPNPDGSPGLFAAFCWIAPGTCGHDGSTPVAQLIALQSGELEWNGGRYGPGQTLYIPANLPSTWRVGGKGYLSAILFNGPPPPATVPAPSGCSVTPDLP